MSNAINGPDIRQIGIVSREYDGHEIDTIATQAVRGWREALLSPWMFYLDHVHHCNTALCCGQARFHRCLPSIAVLVCR